MGFLDIGIKKKIKHKSKKTKQNKTKQNKTNKQTNNNNKKTPRTALVSLAAVFSVVTQRSSPQTATHTLTTFLSCCFINPQKWPIIYQQTENDVNFRAKNEPLLFPVGSEVSAVACSMLQDSGEKSFSKKV